MNTEIEMKGVFKRLKVIDEIWETLQIIPYMSWGSTQVYMWQPNTTQEENDKMIEILKKYKIRG